MRLGNETRTSACSTVLNPDRLVYYVILPAWEKAELRKIRFHEVRHTFGSLLIQDGASPTHVNKQMCRSSIQVNCGRAYKMAGATGKAREAYAAFLATWQNADPDIPILKQAKAEYAKLD